MDRLKNCIQYIVWPERAAARAREEQARREREEEQLRRKEYLLNFFRKMDENFSDFSSIVDSILWENKYNSVVLTIAFNIIFWGMISIGVHSYAAASSAALVIALLCTCTSKLQDSDQITSQRRKEQVARLAKTFRIAFDASSKLREDQPQMFYAFVAAIVIVLWCIVRSFGSSFWAISMCIFVGPVVALVCPYLKESSNIEWDSEIEEFLPAVTEDNLQVLRRAGETGDRSPTPPNPDMDTINDQFEDHELLGLRMPSHEDGSTDGLELSELELSTGDTDIDSIRFQSGHFERGSSSSEDDVDIGLEVKKFEIDGGDDEDDSSDDSEFEIIDSEEIATLKNV